MIDLSRLFVCAIATGTGLTLGFVPLAESMAVPGRSLGPIAPQTDLLHSSQGLSKQPLMLTQKNRVKRIRFAPGAYSATIEDAVVRGTRDIYLVNAGKGQTMTVKIVSLENNAVFAVTAPPNKAGQRRTLIPETVQWSSKLPATGDYQIVVGGTRGNASYKLQVAIQ